MKNMVLSAFITSILLLVHAGFSEYPMNSLLLHRGLCVGSCMDGVGELEDTHSIQKAEKADCLAVGLYSTNYRALSKATTAAFIDFKAQPSHNNFQTFCTQDGNVPN